MIMLWDHRFLVGLLQHRVPQHRNFIPVRLTRLRHVAIMPPVVVAVALVVEAAVPIGMDDDLLELQDQHHHKILGMEADIDALTRELGETVRPPPPAPRAPH